MKLSVGAALAVTLALTCPVQSRNAALKPRDPVPAVNEADRSQGDITSHKEAVTRLVWIRDEVPMTLTPSSTINPSSGHPSASTQRSQRSHTSNGGQPSNQPSAASKNGTEDTKSTASPTYHPNHPNGSGTTRSNNPGDSVDYEHHSHTPIHSEPLNSNRPEPSETPRSSKDPSFFRTHSHISSEILATHSSKSQTSKTSDFSAIPKSSQDPGSSQTPNESPPTHSIESQTLKNSSSSGNLKPSGDLTSSRTHSQSPNESPATYSSESHISKTGGSSETPKSSQDPSSTQNRTESPATHSSESHISKTGGSSETPMSSQYPSSSQEKSGFEFTKTPEQTESASNTPSQAISNPFSTIMSSMVPVTTGGHTTTELLLIPRTTVKVTKGQQTSSVIYTGTSITTSKGSKPTLAWGCVLSDICGSGKSSGGGSSGGCIIPLLCPSKKDWGLGGGWLPSGNPSPGGPPPPSTPKAPSGSGGDDPDEEPEDDKKTTLDDDKKTTTNHETSSSTTSSTSSTSTPSSEAKIRLCMTVFASETAAVSSETTTTSSKTTTSPTSTPTSESKIRLCMSVFASETAAASDETTTTSSKTPDHGGTITTSDKNSNTITSAPTTFATTTKEAESSLCRMSQDPDGPTSCICTSGTTETMLPTQSKDGLCGYSKLPDKTTTTKKKTTDDAPAKTLGPVTSTTTNDELIIWSTQTVKTYILPGTTLTETYPAGDPTTSTITADTPKQTGWSPKGSSICGTGIGDGLKEYCEKAWKNYDDDVVYTKHTSRHHSNSLGMGCTAKYTCSKDSDYVPGLNGKQLKELFANIYDNKGIKRCGSSQLSNGCTVGVDYCNGSGCDDANSKN